MGDPDLVPSGERILWQEDDMEGQCPVVSDRNSSGSDRSKVLSNKYLTSDSDYGTMDEICQMRGTDEYECRVERVLGPGQHSTGHQGKVLHGPAYSVRRYYLIVIVLLYVGQYYAQTFLWLSQ